VCDNSIVTLSPTPPRFPTFYSGASPFLKANPYFLKRVADAAQHCRIFATEDIFEKHGIKLWAADHQITPDLMAKLADRELRKPIELCIRAEDPIKEAALDEMVVRSCEELPALRAAIMPAMDAVRSTVRRFRPNPQALLLISMMRHSGEDHLPHAVRVTSLALAVGLALGHRESELRPLVEAAVLHDVGLLYFPSDPDAPQSPSAYATHPMMSALVAVELAHAGVEVGNIIACSHERLDGSGYPRGIPRDRLTPLARILLFAEAVGERLSPGHEDLTRAAIAARLISNEFDAGMVGWLSRVAESRLMLPSPRDLPEQEYTIGLRMRQLHTQLARITVLLSMPLDEFPAAKDEIDGLLHVQIDPLMRALRASGVEDALALGKFLDPVSPREWVELEALHAEIVDRLVSLGRVVAWRRSENRYLESSPTVSYLLEILKTIARGKP